MKKNIRLLESEFVNLIRKVLSEQETNEQVVKGTGNDPYEYKKEGNKYYTRKKGSSSWIETKGNVADAIATKIFKVNVGPQKTTSTKTTVSLPSTNLKRPDANVGSDTTAKIGQGSQRITKYVMGELERAAELMGKISPKSYEQLNKIIQSKGMGSDSFIIVNKDSSVASLFGPGYKYVAKSPITSGYFKDTGSKEDNLTYRKWFDLTMEYISKNPKSTDSTKVKSYADSIGVKVKDLDFDKHIKGKSPKSFYSYNVLKDKGYAKTPSGVYKLGKSGSVKGYSGTGPNLFPLVDIETGEKIAQAVHGAAGKNRESLLQKAGGEDIRASKDYTRVGSGCVNVNGEFIAQMQKYDPQFVIILPDSGATVDIPKVVPIQTWSDKIAEMGSNCVRSFINLFS
jgi:hypothetical protein